METTRSETTAAALNCFEQQREQQRAPLAWARILPRGPGCFFWLIVQFSQEFPKRRVILGEKIHSPVDRDTYRR